MPKQWTENKGVIDWKPSVMGSFYQRHGNPESAREKQVDVRVILTIHAIEESVDLAHEVFNRVFRHSRWKSSSCGMSDLQESFEGGA